MNKKPDDARGRVWWKEAVFYQVYPRSFLDTNGDGNGDLRGVIEKLDYLKSLGIGAVWLSPIYTSPQVDGGYDIADYDNVDPMYGTMEDFQELIDGLHARDMKLMMDLVINHTSDQHEWFLESKTSRDNPKSDWYVWHDPVDGKEPNDWAAHFGGSAWEWCEARGQYYLHLFTKEQPDLNWKNPDLRKEVFAMITRWLERGVDGFRIDMANFLMKAPGFPPAPRQWGDERPFIHGEHLYANQPGIHEFYKELRKEVLEPFGAITFGEMVFLTPESALEYVASDREEMDMIYQYTIVDQAGNWPGVKHEVRTWYDAFKGRAWNTITFGNHDKPRAVSVFGEDGEYRDVSAKLIATYLLTSPGTPFFLQGEEIGMTNALFDDIGEYTDVWMRRTYDRRVYYGEAPIDVLRDLQKFSRDNARTPMQWSAKPHAGFSKGKPWMRENPNYTDTNVERQESDPDSILNYYRELIHFRSQHPALIYGDFVPLCPDDWMTYAYKRVLGDEEFVMVCNFGSEYFDMLTPDAIKGATVQLVFSNYKDTKAIVGDTFLLRPWEARMYRVIQ